MLCATCGHETDIFAACVACEVQHSECAGCAEARYVAGDGEATPYICAFCRLVQKRVGEIDCAEADEVTDQAPDEPTDADATTDPDLYLEDTLED